MGWYRDMKDMQFSMDFQRSELYDKSRKEPVEFQGKIVYKGIIYTGSKYTIQSILEAERAKKEEKARARVRQSLKLKKYRQQLEDAEKVKMKDIKLVERRHKVEVLRPQTFDEYIGQEKLKKQVSLAIQACRKRNESLPHLLFWGESGLGKTTISCIIAKALNVQVIQVIGSALRDLDNIIQLYKRIRPVTQGQGDVVFIDEVHAMKPKIAEVLYSAMEDHKLSFTSEAGKTQTIDIPNHTILASTTDPGKMPVPLKMRFQQSLQLKPYTPKECAKIAMGYARRIKTRMDSIAGLLIGQRSRGVARIAINHTKNCADYALVNNGNFITPEVVKVKMAEDNVNDIGLTEYDISYLETIYDSPKRRAGLQSVAKAIAVDQRTIEVEVEPYLIRLGFVGTRSGVGRELKDKGIRYMEGLING